MLRRLPFKAVIEREEVFRTADRAEIGAEAMRLTNGAEFHHGMELRGDRYVHVVCFDSESVAKEMQRWIWHSRIATWAPSDELFRRHRLRRYGLARVRDVQEERANHRRDQAQQRQAIEAP